MSQKALLERADYVLELGAETVATQRRSDWGSYVDTSKAAEFRTAALSFLNSVFGSRHPYYSDFSFKVTETKLSDIQHGLGILRAARGEIEGGWLRTTRGLVSGEIFGDFLEMSDHLLDEGYKDAAAVIAGSALEEHLRQLAQVNSVDPNLDRNGQLIPKKADRLNADLAGASIYTKLDQKSVTAWLDLRNKAAHGKYEQYDRDQVALAIEGIRQFIVRVQV